MQSSEATAGVLAVRGQTSFLATKLSIWRRCVCACPAGSCEPLTGWNYVASGGGQMRACMACARQRRLAARTALCGGVRSSRRKNELMYTIRLRGRCQGRSLAERGIWPLTSTRTTTGVISAHAWRVEASAFSFRKYDQGHVPQRQAGSQLELSCTSARSPQVGSSLGARQET